MRKFLFPVVALLPLLAGGCVKTAVGIITAPVKAVGQAADWATTSQDEADRNAGRKARKEEERKAREERKAQKERDRERD
ncbi:MAG: hypothetical protein JWN66_675 [Sphingomonas bacterium]|jgi:hypothetical protein|uniref:hypothetical protein n=1 Tax=Sphingomonas bacterium TaxID=1895847 RepID=UPI00260A6803|nr:hypothetical protein [Sphingomonas bacterium]MDB5703559.1 hypothetical protein [Sphingomonas bacterium]